MPSCINKENCYENMSPTVCSGAVLKGQKKNLRRYILQ